ncbi:hypothetical protein MUO65_02240 [bacterium]|nr:hypothetical protein [bacterium]
MPFKVSKLPSETKNLHQAQEKWRTKNWQKTLGDHHSEIEKMIKKINLFDIWSNKLQKNETAKILIPEIYTDAYLSIHFVCCGLYKYANMCIRAELENALRLVFFSTHPMEFKWWLDGDEWYRETLNFPDVWGRGYTYFEKLQKVKALEKMCDEHKKLFQSGKVGVGNAYKKLSKFIHTGAGHFQARPGSISPKYNLEEFKRWLDIYEEIQTYIQIILALGFEREFLELHNAEKNRLLNLGIDDYYREKVKNALGI